jgi:hypothetical protein
MDVGGQSVSSPDCASPNSFDKRIESNSGGKKCNKIYEFINCMYKVTLDTRSDISP